jgi:predicted RNA binding protein YcfA (HicA-like mRNA interferase family)
MAKLPSLTARKVTQVLARRIRRGRPEGQHLILIHPDTKERTVVPVHSGRTIKEPLLRVIIRDAGLSVDEFIASM